LLKFLFAPLLFVASAAGAQQLAYEMTLVPHLDSVGGINDLGQLAGNVLDANNDRVAAVWTPGATKPFRFLGSPGDFASDINNAGQVAGEHQFAPGQWRAAIFHNGQIQDLGGPDGIPSIGRTINASGQVAGSLGSDPLKSHAFLYANGQMTDLGAFSGERSDAFGINDAGQVVGASLVLGAGGAPNAWRAFEYSEGAMHELDLGGGASIARDINNAGQVVGELAPSGEDGVHAFLYQEGRWQELGNLGGGDTYALSINERGDIVGYGATGRGDTLHGFIYIDGKLVDVNTLLVASDGWEITRASAINEGGQIASQACRIDSQHDCRYALLSPVPEPAAPALWSGGLLLLASRWALRRRSRRHAGLKR
jgi:probable HAF family extracellular repeat protein